RALTHKHLDQEIAQEFPQHWLGVSFYFDIAATQHRPAKIYLVPRDGEQHRVLLTDREDTLKRLIPDEGGRRKVVASSRPAFVFRSGTDLTFRRDYRQPSTLAEFFGWLESMVPETSCRAIDEFARCFPDHLVP